MTNKQIGNRLRAPGLLMLMLSLLVSFGAFAVVPSDIYLRGEINGWGIGDTYKFQQVDDSNVYTLVLEEGTQGEWKIANSDWSWSYGSYDSPQADGNDYKVLWNSSNVPLATYGRTTITFTYNPASEGSTAYTSTISVTEEGTEIPEHIYFRGEQNSWLEGANAATLSQYEFQSIGNNKYQLIIEGGITGGWKIADGSWSWYFGQGDVATVVNGASGELKYHCGDNISLRTDVTTTLTFTYVKNTSRPSMLKAEIDVPTPDAIYFRGDQNNWLNDANDAIKEKYKFTRVGDTDVYELILEEGVTGGWKIANKEWSWFYGNGPVATVIDVSAGELTYKGSENLSFRSGVKTKLTFTLSHNAATPTTLYAEKLGNDLVVPIYFMGDADGWGSGDLSANMEDYKFELLTNNIYQLTIPKGITSEWKIAIKGWGIFFGHGDSPFTFNGDASTVNYGNGQNFNQQSVGETVIQFTYVPGCESNPALKSTVWIKGVECPNGVNFCGQTNDWAANGMGSAGAGAFKFSTDLAACSSTERVYRLNIPNGVFGPWKIRDNNNTWVWDCGAGTGSQPVLGTEYKLTKKGHQILTNSDGSTDLTVSMRLNAEGTDYDVYLTMTGAVPAAYPATLYLGKTLAKGAEDIDTPWDLANMLSAEGTNGIYYFRDVEIVAESAESPYGYVTVTSTINADPAATTWDDVNPGRYSAFTDNQLVDEAHAYGLFKGEQNVWKVRAGRYDIGINVNGYNEDALDVNKDNTRAIVFIPIETEGEGTVPVKLYLQQDGSPSDEGIASTSRIANVYRFEDVHLADLTGYDMGRFCFTTVNSLDWEHGIGSADCFMPELDGTSVADGSAIAVKVYPANSGGGSKYWYYVQPGRYNITLDLSNKEDLHLVAELIELDNPELVLPEKLYLLGHVNGHGWAVDKSAEEIAYISSKDKDDPAYGIYIFDGVTVNSAENNAGYFSFATIIDNGEVPDTGLTGWNLVNTGDRYGANLMDITIELGTPYAVLRYKAPTISPETASWRIHAGVYRFTVDLKNNTITVTESDVSHDVFEYSERWFSKESYTWKDAAGHEHVSYLNEPATDIEQMKYFIAAVYSNKKIPGSKYVRYNPEADLSKNVQSYTGLTADNFDLGEKQIDPALPYYAAWSKLDNYDVLNIPSEVTYPPIEGLENYWPSTAVDTDYTPEKHGLTAILVELNMPVDAAYPYGTTAEGKNKTLKQWYSDRGVNDANVHKDECNWLLEQTDADGTPVVKSMRILTERTYFDSDENPGFLFNIDKPLNHFFIVLKGKPRHSGVGGNMNVTKDIFNYFEQISPTGSDLNGDAQMAFSAYDNLLTGKPFSVVHDCSSILIQDHYFCMDRQVDVGDFERQLNLYVYIPDTRMTYWEYHWDAIKKKIFKYDAKGNLVLDANENRIISDDISYDPQAFGRDWWFLSDKYANLNAMNADFNEVKDHRDYESVKHIGSFTNYNPLFAPYMFTYVLNLDIDGHRPTLDSGDPDIEHYQVDLTWNSNLATVTGASDRNVKEQFMIYPIVDGMIGAPLKASDLASYSLAPGYTENSVISVAGAGENAGALIITTTLPKIKVNLVYNYSINEAARTVEYLVSGKLADKEFVPVQSNEVIHRMDGKQFVLSAEAYVPGSKAEVNVDDFSNSYTHAVRLVLPDGATDKLVKNQMKEGSRIYLMREDVYDSKGRSLPLAYVEVHKVANVPQQWTSRFGKAWAFYYHWHDLTKDKSISAALKMRRANALGVYSDIEAGDILDGNGNNYLLSRRATVNPSDGSDTNSDVYEYDEKTYNTADDLECIYPNDMHWDEINKYYPVTGGHTYFEFIDQPMPVTVSGTDHRDRYVYYFVYDYNGNMYDENGLPQTEENIFNLESMTNKVTFLVPRTEISTELLTYTRKEIENDALHHSLPPASAALNIAVVNNRDISSYDIYRNGTKPTPVASLERNGNGNLAVYLYKNGKKQPNIHATVSQFDTENRTEVIVPLLDEVSSLHRFYGEITRTDAGYEDYEPPTDESGVQEVKAPTQRKHKEFSNRKFLISETPGVVQPTLHITDLKLLTFGTHPTLQNAVASEKTLVADLNIGNEWELEFAHYNIWRTVNNDQYKNNNKELCIRDHDFGVQDNWYDIRDIDDVNNYDCILGVETDESGVISHMHRDGFTVNENTNINDTKAQYTARIYAKVRKVGPLSAPKAGSAAEDVRYVLAETTKTANFASVQTGIDEVAGDNTQQELQANATGNCRLNIVSSTPVRIYNLTGLLVETADAGNVTLTMPATGIYIVKGDSASIKVNVR